MNSRHCAYRVQEGSLTPSRIKSGECEYRGTYIKFHGITDRPMSMGIWNTFVLRFSLNISPFIGKD